MTESLQVNSLGICMPEQTPPYLKPAPRRADWFRILFLFFGGQTVPVSLTLSRQNGQPDLREHLLESILQPVFALSQNNREKILRALIGEASGCDPATCDQACFKNWLEGLTPTHREDILGQLLFGAWDPRIDESARAFSRNGNPSKKSVMDSPYVEEFYGTQLAGPGQKSAIPKHQDLSHHFLQLLLNCLATHRPAGWPEEMWKALVATQPAYARFQRFPSLLEGMERAMNEAVKAVEEANARGADLPAPDFVDIGWNYLKNEEMLRLKTVKRRKPASGSRSHDVPQTDLATHLAVTDPPEHLADDTDSAAHASSDGLDEKKRDFRGRMANTPWQEVFSHHLPQKDCETDPNSVDPLRNSAESKLKKWAKDLLAHLVKEEHYRELSIYQSFLGASANKSLWAIDLVMDVLLRDGNNQRITPDGGVRPPLSPNERGRRSRRLKREEQLFASRTYTWIVELRKHLREWMATDGAELAGNIRTAIWSYWNRLAAIFRNYCEW
ncbi:MAG: hypothetical protein KDA84_18690, partial [Planctomycetaceae bacterium]|nr:hypothetical protein [Planctomycetaceae bacterium]